MGCDFCLPACLASMVWYGVTCNNLARGVALRVGCFRYDKLLNDGMVDYYCGRIYWV